VASFSTGIVRPAMVRISRLRLVRRLVTGTRPGRALAGRFVAGATLDEAIRAATQLDDTGVAAMLDRLGEHAETEDDADRAADAYIEALAAIQARPGLDCAISIKLTQLGLDASAERCRARVDRIAEAARGIVVMIDMESHEYVDSTLDVLRAVHERAPSIGVCLQSCLRRTEQDVFDLPPGARVRLVKGAYLEPADVAYPSKREVDRSFTRLFATLLARGHPVDVATHDPRLVEGVRSRLAGDQDAWSRVEFQMLYGVRRDLQAGLAANGSRLRVYIPYGTEWYPYLTRRLAERPANVWFFLSNLVRGR
jgi:proline dehydrogenase